jgi:hypothetical protein
MFEGGGGQKQKIIIFITKKYPWFLPVFVGLEPIREYASVCIVSKGRHLAAESLCPIPYLYVAAAHA